MEEGVEPVVLGGVEEGAELLGRADRDRTRYLAGLPPAAYALVRPRQGLRPAARREFDAGGRVEGDELLRDGGVERRAQGAAYRLLGDRSRQRRPGLQARGEGACQDGRLLRHRPLPRRFVLLGDLPPQGHRRRTERRECFGRCVAP